MSTPDTTPPPLPDGQYAIVELLGHRTLIGRIAEVSRYGTAMLQIEPVFCGRLLDPILHGGASIYGVTPCSREIAAARGPTSEWSLPAAVRTTLPAEALAAPEPDPIDFEFVADDGDANSEGRV